MARSRLQLTNGFCIALDIELTWRGDRSPLGPTRIACELALPMDE